MTCSECGKRLYISASNCFYCGAVLDQGENKAELETKDEDAILNPTSPFDKQVEEKAPLSELFRNPQSEHQWTNSSQNAASTHPFPLDNLSSPTEGSPPNQAQPFPLDNLSSPTEGSPPKQAHPFPLDNLSSPTEAWPPKQAHPFPLDNLSSPAEAWPPKQAQPFPLDNLSSPTEGSPPKQAQPFPLDNLSSPTAAKPPNQAQPQSIDSCYVYKQNPFKGNAPLRQKSSNPFVPPYTPFVKKDEEKERAQNDEYMAEEAARKRKIVVTTITIAVVVLAIIGGLIHLVLKSKKETADNIAAYYKITDTLEIELLKENWIFKADADRGRSASTIYAGITNKTGYSYKNITFHFSVQDNAENIIGTGRVWYELFEKDTMKAMSIYIDFLGDSDQYLTTGDRVELMGIVGETYNFAEDAPGIVLVAKPDVHRTGKMETDYQVAYNVSATNNSSKATNSMSVIIPITYEDYGGNTVDKEVIRVIIPPLEPEENYNVILENVFEVSAHTKTYLGDYLKRNGYATGDPAVYHIDKNATPYLMNEPYISANLTPFIDGHYSYMKNVRIDSIDYKEFYLSAENLGTRPLYNVTLKVSFYYKNFNKIETVYINIGDLQVENGYGHFGKHTNFYSLYELLGDVEAPLKCPMRAMEKIIMKNLLKQFIIPLMKLMVII